MGDTYRQVTIIRSSFGRKYTSSGVNPRDILNESIGILVLKVLLLDLFHMSDLFVVKLLPFRSYTFSVTVYTTVLNVRCQLILYLLEGTIFQGMSFSLDRQLISRVLLLYRDLTRYLDSFRLVPTTQIGQVYLLSLFLERTHLEVTLSVRVERSPFKVNRVREAS